MRSASAVAIAALALSGCVTTQQSSKRLQLRASRLLASRKPLLVTHPSADVRVAGVSLLRGRSRSAIVVDVANTTGHIVHDVPINVGVGKRYLNRAAGLGYFETHVAAIPPAGRIAWVFTTGRRVGGGRPFAVVGAPQTASALPGLVAAPLVGGRVLIRNPTTVSQYDLPVYAFARRGARYVAAGATTVERLGGGGQQTVPLKLIGRAARAAVHVEVLPSIFE